MFRILIIVIEMNSKQLSFLHLFHMFLLLFSEMRIVKCVLVNLACVVRHLKTTRRTVQLEHFVGAINSDAGFFIFFQRASQQSSG